MTHEEAFILRWIEWNDLNVELIDYVFGLATTKQVGSPEFRNVLGGIYAGIVSPKGKQAFSMPSVDDLAEKYKTSVEVIPEQKLLDGGETKLTYCLGTLERQQNLDFYGPPGPDPRLVFSALTPIAKVPTSSTDFLRLALMAAGLPSGENVEEARFLADKVQVKTYTVDDVLKEKRIVGAYEAVKKESFTKYYELVPGNPPKTVTGFDK